MGVLLRKQQQLSLIILWSKRLTSDSQVPETKGRTLEEMDEIFGSGEARFAAEDAARKERIENDIGLTALLNGDLTGGSGDDKKTGSGAESQEFVEKR